MKKLLFLLLGIIAFAALAVTATAQSVIDTTLINQSDPGSIIAAPATNALMTASIVLLTFLSQIIPGIKKIPFSYLRTAVVVLVVVIGAATWKFGFLTSDSLEYLLNGVAPNFAYSGFVWETLKFLLKIFGIDLKGLAPGSAATLTAKG